MQGQMMPEKSLSSFNDYDYDYDKKGNYFYNMEDAQTYMSEDKSNFEGNDFTFYNKNKLNFTKDLYSFDRSGDQQNNSYERNRSYSGHV